MKVFLVLSVAFALANAVPPYNPIPMRRVPPEDPEHNLRASSCAKVPSWLGSGFDRIVGGSNAKTALPWQVSLRWGYPEGAPADLPVDGSMHFCGGTIVDEYTIVTAAHCFPNGYDGKGDKLMVAAGALKGSVLSGIQLIEAKKTVANTEMKYDANSSNNDIILVKLTKALTFNDNVRPACIPDASFVPESSANTVGIASGWGYLSFKPPRESPDVLQFLPMKIWTNTDCRDPKKSEWANNGEITDNMVCAGDAGGKSTCMGDSGGPLIVNKDGTAVLYGVVSYGLECGEKKGYPPVFTRVTKFSSWIKANLGNK